MLLSTINFREIYPILYALETCALLSCSRIISFPRNSTLSIAFSQVISISEKFLLSIYLPPLSTRIVGSNIYFSVKSFDLTHSILHYSLISIKWIQISNRKPVLKYRVGIYKHRSSMFINLLNNLMDIRSHYSQ